MILAKTCTKLLTSPGFRPLKTLGKKSVYDTALGKCIMCRYHHSAVWCHAPNIHSTLLERPVLKRFAQHRYCKTNLKDESILETDATSDSYKAEGPLIHISSHNAVVACEFIPLQHKLTEPATDSVSQKEDSKHVSSTLATKPLYRSESKIPFAPADRIHLDDLPTNSSALFAYGEETISTGELISRSTEAVRNARLSDEDSIEENKGSVIKAVDQANQEADYQYSDLPSFYASLAKSRLTGLVVATALGGYVMAPLPLTFTTLVGASLGTALVSAAANTTNQLMEVPYDAVMKRTKNRVLVKQLLSRTHVMTFAGTCAVSGVSLLLLTTNPTCAALGLTNLVLYTAVYTPSKRLTIANTWFGAVVGAIPPLIGWTACGGALIGPECWGAWLMAGLLFAWQFPHFNALSWNLRKDYSSAGYRMMCHDNPRLCKVTCVRYSVAMLVLGFAAPALDVTTWLYAMDSTPFNLVMLYLSYRFYKEGDSASSRRLFRFSLVHLPAVILLMIISKKYKSEGTAAGASDYNSKVVYTRTPPRSLGTNSSSAASTTNITSDATSATETSVVRKE